MNKILGLDLGTNSIGWAIRDTFLADNQFEKYGVVTFKKGVGVEKGSEYSFAAERTKRRSIRRLYQARKYRLWATLEVLITNGYCPLTVEELDVWRKYSKPNGREYPNSKSFDDWIKLDFDQNGVQDYRSPYQLRKIAIKRILNKHELGRIFYHIAQRRGFKSSRKSGDKENTSVYSGSKESGALGVNEIKDLIVQEGTLGAALAYIETTGQRVRNRYTLRKHYQEEVEKICENQKIDQESDFFKKINQAIFFQRPLRSQKGLIGRCTLEPEKYRCPISHPSFEEFRAWAFLNNIKYRPLNDLDLKWRELPLTLKKEIYHDKFFRKSKDYFDFLEIEDFIKKKGYNWKFNYKSKTTVSGCIVSARLKEIFGDDWNNLTIDTGKTRTKRNKNKTQKEHAITYNILDIWHILFSFDNEEAVTEFAKDGIKLGDEQIKSFHTAWKSLPDGYAMLSLHAINKILPFLKQGFIYTEAVLLANMPLTLGSEFWELHGTEITSHISDLINDNRNQKQIINIVNSLIAKYKSLPDQDKFGVKNIDYQLDENDKKQIENAIVETYGDKSWHNKTIDEQNKIVTDVTTQYMAFFADYKRDFKKPPHLLDTIKNFLYNNFGTDIADLNKLYHPSQIEIYPKAKPDKEGKIFLGSPKTGAFKNPMAMRTLHELRKLVNYLIEIGEIDDETRIVVELARELNDANRRWAIETWQKRKEEENQEFASAIAELLNEYPQIKASSDKQEDKEKFRLWYEQLPFKIIYKKEPAKKENDNDPRKHDWINLSNQIINQVIQEKDLIKKYRLWKEQKCICLYTGRIITITDLFDENVIDFEHTIARSKSFDNSLSNLTVCYADFNRNIKKNQLPISLGNYETEIKPRLKDWEDKVEAIKTNIQYWEKKSKRATDKEEKDNAIRQKHLWKFELDYWDNKLNRFKLEEITTGFKNSQITDTQLVSKYALHYLRTLFNRVDIQKGSVTSDFRKIYGIQPKLEKKDRSKHSHHAIDAAVLTLIPTASKRDGILKKAYEYSEKYRNKQYHEDPFPMFKLSYIKEIEDNILINNISNDQSLTPAKKIVRKRGKVVYLENEGVKLKDYEGNLVAKISTGDAIRGQLHAETFLAAIKKIKRDEMNNPVQNESREFIFDEDLFFAVREPFIYKANSQSPGFKTLDEIKSNIVDPHLYKIIEKQVGDRPLKEAMDEGIWMLNKNGEKVNKIRHIRIFVRDKKPLRIKKQTFKSEKSLINLASRDHKEFYYAGNASNVLYGFYQDGKDRGFECLNLFDMVQIRNLTSINSLKDCLPITIKHTRSKKDIPLYAILKEGLRVVFFESNPEEVKSLSKFEQLKRLYKITRLFSSITGQIQFQHHLEARQDKELGYGKSTVDMNNFVPRYLLSPINFNFLIEGKDFEINPVGDLIFINNP
jgi:CRISPR-associated endonuclease Csn1